MSSTARPDIFRFVPTDVPGKIHVTFLFFLLPGKSHFFCVDDDHKIARIHMRRENGFLFATQEISSFDRYPAEPLVGFVDYPPLAWDFACFGRKCCHRKKGAQATGGAEGCQPVSALATHESYATHMSHNRNVPINFKNSNHATPRRRFSGMVSAGHSRCGIGRAFGCTGLHGDSPVGLRHLEKNAAQPGRIVPGNGAWNSVLPTFNSASL